MLQVVYKLQKENHHLFWHCFKKFGDVSFIYPKRLIIVGNTHGHSLYSHEVWTQVLCECIYGDISFPKIMPIYSNHLDVKWYHVIKKNCGKYCIIQRLMSIQISTPFKSRKWRYFFLQRIKKYIYVYLTLDFLYV